MCVCVCVEMCERKRGGEHVHTFVPNTKGICKYNIHHALQQHHNITNTPTLQSHHQQNTPTSHQSHLHSRQPSSPPRLAQRIPSHRNTLGHIKHSHKPLYTTGIQTQCPYRELPTEALGVWKVLLLKCSVPAVETVVPLTTKGLVAVGLFGGGGACGMWGMWDV